MGTSYGFDTREYKTAKELIDDRPELAGRDGVYLLYPGGPTNLQYRTKVYCDMTTDGGGWMLMARTHTVSSVANGTWGWRGPKLGEVDDFTRPYQASWWDYWNANNVTRFTEFIYGNRKNINTNEWGPFIYKKTNLPEDFLTNDSQRSSTTVTLSSDTSVYDFTGSPGMQRAIGYPITGTANNIYYLRDCCGFSTYGLQPTMLRTTYCNSSDRQTNSGPWCNGDSYDAQTGDFDQGGTLYGTYTHGGTRQAMLMVR